MSSLYLIGAREPQSVQHRNENVSRNEETQDVGTADEPVLSPVGVYLCRDAYNGHGRLEWRNERQGNGKTAHAPVGQEELLRGALSAAGQSVVQTYGYGGAQQQREYHIVHHREVLQVGRVHRAAAGERFVRHRSHSEENEEWICPHPSVSRVSQPWRQRHNKALIKHCVKEELIHNVYSVF